MPDPREAATALSARTAGAPVWSAAALFWIDPGAYRSNPRGAALAPRVQRVAAEVTR